MKRLLNVTFLLMLFTCINAQNIYVVSVGINNYANIHSLRCCENDVESFNKVLLTHTPNIYTLTGKQASHKKIISTMRDVFSKAYDNDVVVLFFSGHGYYGGFCCYDMSINGAQGGLDYREIQEVFSSCRAKSKMVFADACFSGGMRQKGNNNSVNIAKKSNILFFLSSRTGEMSQETPMGKNGQFTRFLVRGLSGGADKNHDRIISAKELYNFVHNGVKVATHERQHPVMWGNFDNEMSVINWNKRSSHQLK